MKKKTLGFNGTGKRKTARRAVDHTEELYKEYEMYGDAYDEDDGAEADIADGDEYITAYKDGDGGPVSGAYEAEEYEAEEYETEEYESGEYGTEEYALEEYETEPIGPGEYEAEENGIEPSATGAYEAEGYEPEEEEYETEEYASEEYEAEEYEPEEEYEAEEYGPEEYETEPLETIEIAEYEEEEYSAGDSELMHADDYAEDTESYYEYDEEDDDDEDSEEDYESEEYADEDYYEEDAYDDESFETAYGDIDDEYENDIAMFGAQSEAADEPITVRIRNWFRHMTAFDAILALTGVVLVVAAAVLFSMFIQNKNVNAQIEAIAPMGDTLSNMGIVGGEGLLAMADAALSGNFAQEESTTEETSTAEAVDETETSKVNVSFVSVEKDLKIRFTDANTGELITGNVFEVILTNSKGKRLVLTDDDMDGIIYAQNVNPGVFDAVVTSTDKYKFPTVAQQVTVKDKVEYLVVNVQDEVKKESQINVAAEDTQKPAAVQEEVKLTDTVEWVESTKTPVGGSESYLLVDKNTITNPAEIAKAAARMLFDTLNVELDKASLTLNVGASAELKGTSFSDSTEGDVEYKYTTEWKTSDENVASVSDGKVTAKAEGTATITYTVTKKTITATYEPKEAVEETIEISIEEYDALPDEEKKQCTPIKDDAEQVIRYTYKKVTQPEKKTTETSETASAECVITVEAAKIISARLELSKSADSCIVGQTLTVKPAKLVYTKQDESTQTITENFPAVAWTSDNKEIATVGPDGVVTGIKAGKAKITGKISGIKGADDKELDISSSVEVTINAPAELSLTLDRTQDVSLAVGGTTTLVATVSNYSADSGVTWETADKKVATVNEKGVVTGVAPGSTTITAKTKEKNAEGKQLKATCVVTVNSAAMTDTTTKLKDKNGNQIYIKASDGSYAEAVYADYYNASDFYIKTEARYFYTGWQTIDGRTYYFDKNGNAVTGAQIIQGVTYNFGADGAIATTVNGSTFGIDVSRHNGTIDWNAVKASGVDYVIIRCGYRGSSTGVLIEDQNFRTNIKGATAAGLKVGVYVFSQAVNEVEAVKEASLAVSLVKGYNLTYPIFIDTESSGGRADKIDKATRTAVVNAFCQTVASAGYKPGIYASKTWLEGRLNMGAIGNYKIWLAQYAPAPTYKGRYDMWQYTSKGTINGIKGNVDLNYSYLGY